MKVMGMLIFSLRGVKLQILLSLRVFRTESQYLLMQVLLRVDYERKLKIYDNASKI